MSIDYLNIIILPYMHAKGMTQKEAAKILGMSQKTFGVKLKQGVSTWPLLDILRLGKALGIPVETLREHIRYTP